VGQPLGNVKTAEVRISSSLDETTERDLFARLFATYPQKTIIFITHRTSIAALCNDVVRL